MAELLLHGRPVETMFDLLGRDENDMTFALAWGMASSDHLLSALMARVSPATFDSPNAAINLQRADEHGGYTDIEVTVPDAVHVIFEAKRGWNLPLDAQLRLYAERLSSGSAPERRLVVLTQWGATSYVAQHVATWGLPFPVEVLGWSDVVDEMLAAARSSPRGQRPLLRELGTYLMGVADMRDIDSNSVYVVSLGRGRDTGWAMTYVDVVEQHNRYFYPATGKGWPKVPPNYIAFRYDGRLQSVRHVDDYTVATDMSKFFPGVPSGEWEPHFVVDLGPPIVPDHAVPNGDVIRRAMRVWADIDLLLTGNSISDALLRTKARRST